MLNYKAIEIFTNEEARCSGKPVADAVVQYVRDLKLAARCTVSRGISGCYESGEMTTGRLEILSYNLPLHINIVLPADACDQVLDGLDVLVCDGIIAVKDLMVVSHKTASTFFPRQLTVRDVMTKSPVSITADQKLDTATNLLLSSIFTGLPVVDEIGHPLGVITQGDLINRGGLPLRLGILVNSEENDRETIMTALSHKQVHEVMSKPAVCIGDEQPLTKAVELMLEKRLKRLPVVNSENILVGMLSRLDIFTTVMREAPDWKAFHAQKITVNNLHTVRDILRQDTKTVSSKTPLDKVMQIIDGNDIQCVAVVDETNHLVGMIADSDLLHYFKPDPQGVRALFALLTHPLSADLAEKLSSTTAGEVMRTELQIADENMVLEEAITLMTQEQLKRLPVVDKQGHFQGMISRDSLLRTGYKSLRES
ncbi:DUF190 domain-containing protein [Desulfobulbus rhabdoformis]|nr:DUF190 domain-containing protein [Desulfobulbus rhabdoformis]